ncbi:hypothetical protein KOI35_17850 [Actinoplanes bogorensis]|uniref:Uncharacterized protein n=1 Tax=Paractinoplanes bogorensis TaxID=1610840 RepID=A0ABS5YRK9_9ACTN|nr:hypothetical protein [Actinoplanes bogorensis]MBU2665373.1 hypothetical protein [Actinoplanes bogorensis]
MARSANLMIPAPTVGMLSIPARAVTTGEPHPTWVSVRVGVRGPKISLPYDRTSAARVRVWAWYRPLYAILTLVVGGYGIWRITQEHTFPLDALAASALLYLGVLVFRIRVHPEATDDGDVFLPGVHDDVAAEWLDANPSIYQHDPPRTFFRRGFPF